MDKIKKQLMSSRLNWNKNWTSIISIDISIDIWIDIELTILFILTKSITFLYFLSINSFALSFISF